MQPYIPSIAKESGSGSDTTRVGTSEVIETFRRIDRSKEPPCILYLPATWTNESLQLRDSLGLNIFLDASSPVSLIHHNMGRRVLTVADAATLLYEVPSTWNHPFFERIDGAFLKMLKAGVPPLFLSRRTLLTEGNIIDGNHRLIVMAYYYLFEGVDYPPLDVFWANFSIEHYLNWLRGSFHTQLLVDPKSAIQLARSRLGGMFR